MTTKETQPGATPTEAGFDPKSGMLPTLKLVEARHGDSLQKTSRESALLDRERVLQTRLGNAATIHMDVLRRQKDRSYKNVFKGSVLVGTLMDHDENKFATRTSAIKFAQKLLDAGHIESIVGSSMFEDSVHLYRWADETVVREAKKMVSTTSHIPRKKLIELVDMNQSELNDDTYDMRDVKDKLIAKFQAERPTQMAFASKEERRASRKERAARRRTLGAMQIGEAMDELNNATTTDENGQIINNNTSSARRSRLNSDLVASNNSTNLSRAGSQSQENLGFVNGYTSADEVGAAMGRRRRRRDRSPPSSPTAADRLDTDAGVDDAAGDGEVVSSRQSRRRRAAALLNSRSSVDADSTNTALSTRNGDLNLDSSKSGVISNKLDKDSKDSQEEVIVPSTTPSPAPPCTDPTCGGDLADSNTKSDSNNNASGKEDKIIDANIGNSSSSKKDHKNSGDGDVSTCVYDGVEMKALDIEHVDFSLIRPDPNSTRKSLQGLDELSNSYSDNEKQLFEQMKRMQADHEKVVKSYEERITELLANMAELRHLASKVETRNGLSAGEHANTVGLNGHSENGSVSSESDVTSPSPPTTMGVIAPPPVPPPPLPPLGFPLIAKSAKPSKSPVKPRLKMRPLFWNRIILEKKDELPKEKKELTFWHVANELKFDIDAFERLFGKADDEKTLRVKSLHDAMSSAKGKGRVQGQGAIGQLQTAKILEDNRSRAVAIKLRSMHCQMSDIKQAVYKMEYSKIDLDSLYSLYLIKGTKSELDRISVHLQCHEDVPLDQPEQFLWELSQMSHFPERIECMMLQKRFNETVFNIDQQLSTVDQAAYEIRHNPALRTIMESILSFGNYMNGSTQRGQADGFEYTILAKIKDVKSIDNSTNLLQYIVRTYMKEHEEDAGKDEAVFRLPDPSIMTQAGQVSFAEVALELNNLSHQLQSHSKQARLVCQDTEGNLLQPFKDKMDDFFETAEGMIKDQQEKLEETKAAFQDLLRYLAVKDTTEQTTPEIMFSIWFTFIESFKTYWKLEHKRIARMMFEKVEQKKRNRMRAARRRKSTVEDGKSNMKQRFALLRRRSENVNPTVKMLRSQSMTEQAAAESDSDICRRSTGAGDGDDLRARRRRRPQSDNVYADSSVSSAAAGASDPLVNYHSDASVGPPHTSGGNTRSETLSERMQRRRRSRINSEEVQNNIQNAMQNGNGSSSPRHFRQRSLEEENNLKHLARAGDGSSGHSTMAGRRFNSVSSIDSVGFGYASDTADRLNSSARQPWQHQQQQVDDNGYGVNATNNNSQNTQDSLHAQHRRRRRAGVVSRNGDADASYMSDAAVEEHAVSARRREAARYNRGLKNADSLASLTDATRYRPAGDRSPVVPTATSQTTAATQNGHHHQHHPQQQQQQRSRSYAPHSNGVDDFRTASPASSTLSDYSHDPGAPPRPALPSQYNLRAGSSQQGSSDNDIMDTDQEKINYREAIRKMSGSSGGPRRRSGEPRSRSREPLVR